MAAGAQITHSRYEEVVTKNNEVVLYEAHHRNGYNSNPLTSINERASLVPAAAVIPALKMHRTIAAVKKLVVGSVPAPWSTLTGGTVCAGFLAGLRVRRPSLVGGRGWLLYFEQIRVLSTGVSPECSCME
jgi:hypothetical protein